LYTTVYSYQTQSLLLVHKIRRCFYWYYNRVKSQPMNFSSQIVHS